MAGPQVGVVIPLHNGETHIRRAVASVLRQSHDDLTLVVVDDASTDAGARWGEQHPDPRVRLLHNAENLGPGASRNAGLRSCETEWVGLLDADDAWDEHFLERTLAAACRTSGLCAVYTHVAVASDDAPRPASMAAGVVSDYFAARLEHLAAMTPSSTLVRREHLLAQGGFLETCRYGEDVETWFRLVCSGEVYFIPEPLAVKHLDAPGSLVRTLDHTRRVEGLAALLSTYEHYDSESRIPAGLAKSCAAFMAQQRAYLALHMIRSGRRRSGLQLLFTRVRPGRFTWREYLRCLKSALS